MHTKPPPDSIEVGAVTDEFSPDSLDRALAAIDAFLDSVCPR